MQVLLLLVCLQVPFSALQALCPLWGLNLGSGGAGEQEGALATVRAQCKLLVWVWDPPGDNFNHQQAARKEQKLPRSLRDLLATIKKPWEDGYCACN